MATTETYRDIVHRVALDNYGYATTRAAAAAGVPPIELPKLAQRGRLENVGYGLYRVPLTPPHELDQYAEAVLRAGDGAFLHGESVLAMFGLADVNPRRIKVAVPKRMRAALPEHIQVTRAQPDANTTLYEGIAAQTVEHALLECRGRIQTDRLIAAAKDARAQGLLTTTQWRRVRRALRQ